MHHLISAQIELSKGLHESTSKKTKKYEPNQVIKVYTVFEAFHLSRPGPPARRGPLLMYVPGTGEEYEKPT